MSLRQHLAGYRLETNSTPSGYINEQIKSFTPRQLQVLNEMLNNPQHAAMLAILLAQNGQGLPQQQSHLIDNDQQDLLVPQEIDWKQVVNERHGKGKKRCTCGARDNGETEVQNVIVENEDDDMLMPMAPMKW